MSYIWQTNIWNNYIILNMYFGEILIRCKKDNKHNVLKYYYTTDTNRDINMLQYTTTWEIVFSVINSSKWDNLNVFHYQIQTWCYGQEEDRNQFREHIPRRVYRIYILNLFSQSQTPNSSMCDNPLLSHIVFHLRWTIFHLRWEILVQNNLLFTVVKGK